MNNLLGEFLGTMFLIILGDGVVANVVLAKNKGFNSGWIVITTGWAMAVMVGVFVAISAGAPQADINPAVTIGKWLILGVYPAGTAIVTMVVQVAGAFVGGVIVWLAYLNHWAPTTTRGPSWQSSALAPPYVIPSTTSSQRSSAPWCC